MKSIFLAALVVAMGFFAHAQDVVEPTPADTADKVARSPGGKLVRIVGARYDKEATPTPDTSLGDVVEVVEGDFTPQSLCHILLKGMPILDADSGKMIPFLEEFFPMFGEASWPVMLARSCNIVDGCFWIVLLKAADCVKAADLDGYQASGMWEIVALNSADLQERGRYLWTDGTCVDPEAGAHECSVPVSDPTAIAKRDVFVFSSWMGRTDLNFAKAKEGVVQPRGVAEVKEIP